MRVQAGLVGQMEWNVRRVLGNDTAAISTLRCLKLYLERLGCNFLAQETVHALAGSSFALVSPPTPSPPILELGLLRIRAWRFWQRYLFCCVPVFVPRVLLGTGRVLCRAE